MTFLLAWKKLTLGKSRILNSQHLIDAIHVVDQAQNQVKAQVHALCVVAMDKFVLVKVFLLFNKHALNALVQVNKLLIHVKVVVAKVKNKQAKDFL